jgi:hypothetical protein
MLQRTTDTNEPIQVRLQWIFCLLYFTNIKVLLRGIQFTSVQLTIIQLIQVGDFCDIFVGAPNMYFTVHL